MARGSLVWYSAGLCLRTLLACECQGDNGGQVPGRIPVPKQGSVSRREANEMKLNVEVEDEVNKRKIKRRKKRNVKRDNDKQEEINLQTPCILYIGQTYHYSPEYTFYIFSQQIYLIIFFSLSLTIFVYSYTKYGVFSNITLLGS